MAGRVINGDCTCGICVPSDMAVAGDLNHYRSDWTAPLALTQTNRIAGPISPFASTADIAAWIDNDHGGPDIKPATVQRWFLPQTQHRTVFNAT